MPASVKLQKLTSSSDNCTNRQISTMPSSRMLLQLDICSLQTWDIDNVRRELIHLIMQRCCLSMQAATDAVSAIRSR